MRAARTQLEFRGRCGRARSRLQGAAVQNEGAVVSIPVSFLLLHASVLEPNDHLRLTEPEGTRHLHAPGPGQILIEVRLFQIHPFDAFSYALSWRCRSVVSSGHASTQRRGPQS